MVHWPQHFARNLALLLLFLASFHPPELPRLARKLPQATTRALALLPELHVLVFLPASVGLLLEQFLELLDQHSGLLELSGLLANGQLALASELPGTVKVRLGPGLESQSAAQIPFTLRP